MAARTLEEINYGNGYGLIIVSLSYEVNLVVFHDYLLKFGSSGRKSFRLISFLNENPK
jgi:hypothetical protein